MPSGELSENEWKKCVFAVDEIDPLEFIVVSGSIPPGVPLSMFAGLSEITSRKKAKLIVDTSGPALKEALLQGVYLAKPNLGELAQLAGIERIGNNQVEEIARSVLDTYDCKVIIVSLGKEGAMLVTKNEMHQVTPPPVTKKSTIGAGDSMVAGIIYSLENGSNLLRALQYGVACGTAATMNPGTELCTKSDADRLFSIISKQ
jgi:6-phosphofructokinase 2